MSAFKKYWVATLLGTLLISAYPLHMGIRSVWAMLTQGYVAHEAFPKYMIPYTPIALSLIAAVLLMPLLLRYVKRFALAAGTGAALVTFAVTENFFENAILVEGDVLLENWQMSSCMVLPDQFVTRPWHVTAAEILVGDYSPWFKLHFYLIAVVLIVAILRCLYGFARVIRTGDRSRCRALTAQSISTTLFLGLCILACLTAFWRTGELTVSPLSAFLMGLFFAVMGLTVGSYVGSFFIGKMPFLSFVLPTLAASVTTLLMYVGELLLLHGHLYRFGTGFLFEGLPLVVLAPIDLLIVLLAGVFTAVLCYLLREKKTV